jgi:amino acid adenylation domain-containing protein
VYVLHHLLSDAADRDPDHVAVRCRGRSLTYGELESAANGIASRLVEAGIRRGDRVGIHLSKCIEMVVAVYGVLKAGGAYVPLDPKAPSSRVGTIASDCRIGALVSTPARASSLLTTMNADGPRLILLVDDGTEPESILPEPISFSEALVGGEDPRVPAIDADLAYILYTSGSTGVPKGVMLTHRHALTFVRWCATKIPVGPSDRFSNHAPLHFDLSVFDLYVSALVGATVVLVPDEHVYFGTELATFVEREAISVWYSVPSALMLMARGLQSPGALPHLRHVVFAGEVYPTPEIRKLRDLLPAAELWNLYGPTETNVCTFYHVDDLPEDHLPIPIGRACENTEVFAIREDGEIAGVGEEGELHVRGSTVMAGYWGLPGKTAEVLVPNPTSTGTRDLVYRTGDLVRLRPDGDYEFLGRRDHQIKSRGYRIELGDIEAALGADPALLESATVAVPHPEWGTEVIAWVVPKNGADITETIVKRHVAGLLPRYMVPSRVVIADALPRTSNGKVDRSRLTEASLDAAIR